MSLEEMVRLIALNTTLCSFQRETFKFQQETRAQIQDLTNQVHEYISSQSRWEVKEEARLVDESKLQAAIDEEDEEVAASESHSDNKGGNVIEQRPMVVSLSTLSH